MASQPPVRPWFRLGSIRAATVPPPPSAPAPPPPPPPEPRPFMSLPTFRTASAPPSPQTQPTQPRDPPPPAEPALRLVPSDVRVSAPSSPAQQQRYSAPSSPIQKAAFPSSSSLPSSPSRKPTTATSPQSPRTIKQASPRQSPKLIPSAPPPSPLTLPPSQVRAEPRIPMEAEPKTVLVQKTVDKPKQWLNGETGEHRNHTSSHSHHGKHASAEAKEKGVHKKVSDPEESGMRVITIAGENRGAYMELVQSQKKHEPSYLHNKKGIGGDESEMWSGGEEGGKRKDKSSKGRAASSLPMSAYMNSNVQCVNNSLLYHASCSHHDPGVRLSLTKKPFGEGYHLKERVDGGHEVV